MSDCYLQLLKMKQDRSKSLQVYQQRLKHDERVMLHIKQQIAICLERQARLQSHYDRRLEQNEWVTAQQHAALHNAKDLLSKEYSELMAQKEARLCLIEEATLAAESTAVHLIGIEKGLVSLAQYLNQMDPTMQEQSNKLLQTWLIKKDGLIYNKLCL